MSMTLRRVMDLGSGVPLVIAGAGLAIEDLIFELFATAQILGLMFLVAAGVLSVRSKLYWYFVWLIPIALLHPWLNPAIWFGYLRPRLPSARSGDQLEPA